MAPATGVALTVKLTVFEFTVPHVPLVTAQ